jgi:predicted TIM-barrel fold metal-dependent hydrolase
MIVDAHQHFWNLERETIGVLEDVAPQHAGALLSGTAVRLYGLDPNL